MTCKCNVKGGIKIGLDVQILNVTFLHFSLLEFLAPTWQQINTPIMNEC